jgi:hypothetical protein
MRGSGDVRPFFRRNNRSSGIFAAGKDGAERRNCTDRGPLLCLGLLEWSLPFPQTAKRLIFAVGASPPWYEKSSGKIPKKKDK